MEILRLRTKLFTWLALAVLLVFALVPAMGRASSRAPGGHGHELCALHRWERLALQGSAVAEVAANAVTDAAQVQAASHLEHCLDCSRASQVLLPAPLLAPLLLARGADYLAPLFLQARRPLFAWRGPQSRAPPLRA